MKFRRVLGGAACLFTLSGSAGALGAEKNFDLWLHEFRREAASQGISEGTLSKAFEGVKPIPRVIELDRRQPEKTITFEQYRKNVVTGDRVQKGRMLLNRHRALLENVAARYGVQPRFVVALWAIETNFGQNTGGFKVVNSLATLAHDGRRTEFFRNELTEALKILDEGHVAPSRMKGSWAGAMGQPQFMPSSFQRYAVDFNEDGRRDIWDTEADVFASAANYLASHGWKGDQTWGREVKVPRSFSKELAGLETSKLLSEWQRLGVRQANGQDLPAAAMQGSIVFPDGEQGSAFLVYDNYRAVMSWNRSLYFATSVGLLADRIGG